jgi:hypothetical protein
VGKGKALQTLAVASLDRNVLRLCLRTMHVAHACRSSLQIAMSKHQMLTINYSVLTPNTYSITYFALHILRAKPTTESMFAPLARSTDEQHPIAMPGVSYFRCSPPNGFRVNCFPPWSGKLAVPAHLPEGRHLLSFLDPSVIQAVAEGDHVFLEPEVDRQVIACGALGRHLKKEDLRTSACPS